MLGRIGVALVGAGSLLWIANDNYHAREADQVKSLVKQAVELDQEKNPTARRKWIESAAVAKGTNLSTPVQFTIAFGLAHSFEQNGDLELAEAQFRKALNVFPPDTDVRSLTPAVRLKLATVYDRLAQRQQDRKDYQSALDLYAKALEALADADQVDEPSPEFLDLCENVTALAGVLNNVATLYVALNRDNAAQMLVDKSDKLMGKLADHNSVTEAKN